MKMERKIKGIVRGIEVWDIVEHFTIESNKFNNSEIKIKEEFKNIVQEMEKLGYFLFSSQDSLQNENGDYNIFLTFWEL